MSRRRAVKARTQDDVVFGLQAEMERLRSALQRINERATDMLGDLPQSTKVPHVMASGHVLTLQGIAAAALEE